MTEPEGPADPTGLEDGPVQPIGLFGGSFNPPHLAHLALARLAFERLGLAQVLWTPAGQPWQKAGQEVSHGPHRAAMVAELITGEPGFVLDEREIQRCGPSYTLVTVRQLQAEHPGAEIVLIIGQDQYARLHTWHGAAELLAAVTLAVAGREGQAPEPSEVLAGLPHRIMPLPLPRLDISSTQIRARVKAGEPVDSLVGTRVARYIDHHHLYQGTP